MPNLHRPVDATRQFCGIWSGGVNWVELQRHSSRSDACVYPKLVLLVVYQAKRFVRKHVSEMIFCVEWGRSGIHVSYVLLCVNGFVFASARRSCGLQQYSSISVVCHTAVICRTTPKHVDKPSCIWPR